MGAIQCDWNVLRDMISGKVVLPKDDDYDLARALQIVEFDKVRPSAIVFCENVQDVQQSILFAKQAGIEVVPRSGRHSCAGYSTTTGLVIDVSRMNDIAIVGKEIRVGAGVQTVDLYDKTLNYGLSIPSGLCATVGIAGLTLGGGIGLATRKYGVTCDSVKEIEIVLADGRVINCDPHHYADLFWALRGCGGGNFGIVTSLVFTAKPAKDITSYSLEWPWSVATQVVQAWQLWAPNAPDNLCSTLRIVLEYAAYASSPCVTVVGGWLGESAELTAILDQLINSVGVAPISRYSHTDSYRKTMMSWMMCAEYTLEESHRVGSNPMAKLPRDVFNRNRGYFVSKPIPMTGIERILNAFNSYREPTQNRSLELGAMGGACNRIPSDATAFFHRNNLFYAGFTAETQNTINTQLRYAAKQWIDNCHATLRRWSSPYSYQNTPDPELENWREAYYGDNYPRLLEIRKIYDPENFFCRTQSID